MSMMRGTLEILQMADSGEPKSFNDFTMMPIKEKNLSSATVSKRINELIAVEAMEEVVTRSKKGRRVIAYKTTEKGRKVIVRAKRLEEALTASKSK